MKNIISKVIRQVNTEELLVIAAPSLKAAVLLTMEGKSVPTAAKPLAAAIENAFEKEVAAMEKFYLVVKSFLG